MKTQEIETRTIKDFVSMVENGKSSLTFRSKATRQEVARTLRLMGYKVGYSSSRNQLLHPEYVDDFEGTIETGFGNMMYKTYFPALYCLAVIERPAGSEGGLR